MPLDRIPYRDKKYEVALCIRKGLINAIPGYWVSLALDKL